MDQIGTLHTLRKYSTPCARGHEACFSQTNVLESHQRYPHGPKVGHGISHRVPGWKASAMLAEW